MVDVGSRNAPMPHLIFFHRRYAIHGTTPVDLRRPASRGCMRLSPGAAALFAMVQSQGRKSASAGGGRLTHAHGTHKSDLTVAYASCARTLDEWRATPIEALTEQPMLGRAS